MNEKTDMRMKKTNKNVLLPTPRNQEQGNSKARRMGEEYSSERREVAYPLNGNLRWVESIVGRGG